MAKIKGKWQWNEYVPYSKQIKDLSITFKSPPTATNANQGLGIWNGIVYGQIYVTEYDSTAGLYKLGKNFRIMDFGNEYQEINDDVYNFIIANAIMLVNPKIKGKWRWKDGIEDIGVDPDVIIDRTITFDSGDYTFDRIGIDLSTPEINYLVDNTIESFLCFDNGNPVINEEYRIIDFGPEPIEVDEEFYNFIVEYAEVAPLTTAEKIVQAFVNGQKISEAILHKLELLGEDVKGLQEDIGSIDEALDTVLDIQDRLIGGDD